MRYMVVRITTERFEVESEDKESAIEIASEQEIVPDAHIQMLVDEFNPTGFLRGEIVAHKDTVCMVADVSGDVLSLVETDGEEHRTISSNVYRLSIDPDSLEAYQQEALGGLEDA